MGAQERFNASRNGIFGIAREVTDQHYAHTDDTYTGNASFDALTYQSLTIMRHWTGYIRFHSSHPEDLREQRQMMAEAEEMLRIRRIEVEIAGLDDEWPVLTEILNQLEHGYETYSTDGLIVCSFDRMGRSTDDLAQKMSYLRAINTPVQSIEDEITLFDYRDSAESIPPLIRALGTFEARLAHERAELERIKQARNKQARIEQTREHQHQLQPLRRSDEAAEEEHNGHNAPKQLGDGPREQLASEQQTSDKQTSEQKRPGGRAPALTEDDIPEVQQLMRAPEVSVQEICDHFDVSKATLYRYVGPEGERRK